MADPERRETDATVCPTCRGSMIVGGQEFFGGKLHPVPRNCPDCNGTGRVPEKGEG